MQTFLPWDFMNPKAIISRIMVRSIKNDRAAFNDDRMTPRENPMII
jgi:hypothetical protein